MTWNVEFTNEFGGWWETLDEGEQKSVAVGVTLLEDFGPTLKFPHTSGVKSSRHSHMRELRVQHQGAPYRVLYAFDPRRTAILLLGGSKVGDDRWYEVNVPRADDIYDRYVEELKREGVING